MTNGAVHPAIHKAAVALIGLGAAAVGFFVALLLAIIAGFSCGGSDASAPSDSWVCRHPVDDTFVIGGWALAVGGPLLGMVASLAVSRWRPLWVGVAAGVAGLIALLFVVAASG